MEEVVDQFVTAKRTVQEFENGCQFINFRDESEEGTASATKYAHLCSKYLSLKPLKIHPIAEFERLPSEHHQPLTRARPPPDDTRIRTFYTS